MAAALTQTDVELESRLLLSGTSDSQQSDSTTAGATTGENVAAALTVSSATFDSFDRLTISFDDGADVFVTSAYAVVTQETEGETATANYVVVSTASTHGSGTVSQYQLQFDGTGSRLVPLSTSDHSRGPISPVLDLVADRPASAVNDQIIDLSQQNPISNDLLAKLLTPPPDESPFAAKSSPTDASRTAPVASASYADEAGTAGDVSAESTAISGVLVDRAADLFFSFADTPLWNIDGDDPLLRLPDAADRSDRPLLATTGFDLAGQSSQQREQSASLGLSAVRSQKPTAHAAGRSTDVFTTSESKTAFAQLLNSLVQFDTSEFFATDSQLSDWLSEQLDLASEDNGSQDLDATTNTSYADSTDTAHDEQRVERLQQAYLKIDFLLTGAAAVAVLAGHSPGPPEITGMWQRICFECNPRGPPASDQNSGSDIHQMAAGCIQLQQLRYSISPRGPSVVSVN